MLAIQPKQDILTLHLPSSALCHALCFAIASLILEHEGRSTALRLVLGYVPIL